MTSLHPPEFVQVDRSAPAGAKTDHDGDRASSGGITAPVGRALDRRAIGGLAAAVLLSLAVALPFLPGTFIPDSFDQYAQALADRYADWHPPILTAIWGFFDAPPELVLILFVTMTIVSAVALVQTETPWSWAVGAVAVVAFWPMTIGWLTSIHKDAWLLAFFLAGAMAFARARQASGRSRLVFLAITAVAWWLAASARHNALAPIAAALALGWPIVVPAAADRVARLRNTAWQFCKRGLVAAALCGCIVVTQSVWTSLVVEPRDDSPQQAVYQFDLAGMSIREGEMLLPPSSLKPGATLEQLSAVFDAGEGQALFFSAETPIIYPVGVGRQLDDLREAWTRTIRERPGAYLRQRADYATSLLGIDQETYGIYVSAPSPEQSPERWGFEFEVHDRYFPSLWRWFDERLRAADLGWASHVRVWMYAVVLIGIGLTRRGRGSVAVRTLASAGLASQLSIAAAGMTSIYRYSWFMTVCSLLALAIAGRWGVESLRGHVAARRAGSLDPPVNPDLSAAS